MQESDWCDLICEPPYQRKGVYQCKNPKASQKLDWKPIGIVGEIYIDDDMFLRCIVRREESQQFNPESILSYHSSEVIDNMFYWYIKNGYGVLSDKVPNTGLYMKMKLNGSKLQIISDHSNVNKADEIRPRSFKLFSPEDMKCIMRKIVDLWFFSFDISNFFHSFVISKLMRVLLFCFRLPHNILAIFPGHFSFSIQGSQKHIHQIKCSSFGKFSVGSGQIAKIHAYCWQVPN